MALSERTTVRLPLATFLAVLAAVAAGGGAWWTLRAEVQASHAEAAAARQEAQAVRLELASLAAYLRGKGVVP